MYVSRERDRQLQKRVDCCLCVFSDIAPAAPARAHKATPPPRPAARSHSLFAFSSPSQKQQQPSPNAPFNHSQQ